MVETFNKEMSTHKTIARPDNGQRPFGVFALFFNTIIQRTIGKKGGFLNGFRNLQQIEDLKFPARLADVKQ